MILLKPRPFVDLSGATIASNLVPSFHEKIFSLEIDKNDISLGRSSEKNARFFKCSP